MHELALSTGIVDTVVRHARGRQVRVVTMTVGALRQVVPESLEFYFEIVSRDSVCEGATLEQQLVPARLRCNACEREWELDFPDFRCADCNGTDVDVLAGSEFEVESIEVEEEEACTAPR